MDDGQPTPPLAPDTALDWPEHSATGAAVLAAVERRVRQRRRTRRRAAGALAAGALLAIVAFTWPDTTPRQPTDAWAATAPAPSTRQVLADGSEIELNGDAAVQVEFEPTVRRVVIVRGEAHFEVKSDPARPFVVVAGDVAVRAVGTAFAVQLAPAGVDVLVTEGRVAVDRAATEPAETPAPPLAFVAAGARVTVAAADLTPSAAAPVVTPVTPAEMAARLAWRVPRLDLNDTPLRDAVELFNRHSRVRLFFAEPGLGDLRISGTVRADNVPALLELLRADYGVAAERRGDREVVLFRR